MGLRAQQPHFAAPQETGARVCRGSCSLPGRLMKGAQLLRKAVSAPKAEICTGSLWSHAKMSVGGDSR